MVRSQRACLCALGRFLHVHKAKEEATAPLATAHAHNWSRE